MPDCIQAILQVCNNMTLSHVCNFTVYTYAFLLVISLFQIYDFKLHLLWFNMLTLLFTLKSIVILDGRFGSNRQKTPFSELEGYGLPCVQSPPSSVAAGERWPPLSSITRALACNWQSRLCMRLSDNSARLSQILTRPPVFHIWCASACRLLVSAFSWVLYRASRRCSCGWSSVRQWASRRLMHASIGAISIIYRLLKLATWRREGWLAPFRRRVQKRHFPQTGLPVRRSCGLLSDGIPQHCVS